MAKLDKDKWLSKNTYEFERDSKGNFLIVVNDTHSEIDVVKEQLPDNSITKFIINRLKREGVLAK